MDLSCRLLLGKIHASVTPFSTVMKSNTPESSQIHVRTFGSTIASKVKTWDFLST